MLGGTMNKYVIIDLETTGNSVDAGDRIIEVGIVTIEHDEITNSYSTFINPGKEVPSFISSLTTITNEDVAGAPHFYEKAVEITDYFSDAYFIAHNVPFDLNFLNNELAQYGFKKLTNPTIDTVELARILYPQAPSYQLERLADYLNLNHERPHRALADATVTAQLFLAMKKKLQSLPFETISHLLRLENQFHSDLYHLLKRTYEHLIKHGKSHEQMTTYRSLAIKKVDAIDEKQEAIDLPFGFFLDDLYETDGLLATTKNNYEYRQGQREISEVIYHAFQKKNNALIEAGTGIGKTLAYLTTALYHSMKEKRRVVISTYTVHLQTQILDEVAQLNDLLPFPFTVSLLKGKSRYLSLERFDQVLNETDYENNNYDATLTKAMLLIWLTETDTGDIDELQLSVNGEAFFKRVSAESDELNDLHDELRNYCYYERALRQAEHANVIVTNHALLCADIHQNYHLLPAYDDVIIDEAHHLTRVVTNYFGVDIDYSTIHYTYNKVSGTDSNGWINDHLVNRQDIYTFLEVNRRWSDTWSLVKQLTDDIFDQLYTYVMNEQTNEMNDVGKIECTLRQSFLKNDSLMSLTNQLFNQLTDLTQTLHDMKSFMRTRNDEAERYIYRQQLIELVNKLRAFFATHDDKRVYWLSCDEKSGKSSMTLRSEQVDVSHFLREHLFSKKESVILTSATLTTRKDSFTYLMDRLGLHASHTLTKQIESPFSLKDQMKLLIPNDFPLLTDTNEDEYIYAVAEAILSLATITKGRMLVLFTSYRMLSKTHFLLKEIMELHETHDFMLISQGISSGSRSRLKKNFQMFERAILLGTNSFWEGFDVPGSQLSAVVITRLPFQRPNHPTFLAEKQLIESEEKNSFVQLALPDAMLRFKQGIGRLIRSQSDRGVVFVCDKRLVEANYSKSFIDSIGDIPIYNELTSQLLQRAEQTFIRDV